jgi:hypothetical protein
MPKKNYYWKFHNLRYFYLSILIKDGNILTIILKPITKVACLLLIKFKRAYLSHSHAILLY